MSLGFLLETATATSLNIVTICYANDTRSPASATASMPLPLTFPLFFIITCVFNLNYLHLRSFLANFDIMVVVIIRTRRPAFPQFKLISQANSIRIFPRYRHSISARGTAATKTTISTKITPTDGQRPDTRRTVADANSPLRDATTEEKSDALITGGDASQGVGGGHRRRPSSFSRNSSTGSLDTVQEEKEYAPNEVDSLVSPGDEDRER